MIDSDLIREKAFASGFDLVKVAGAEILPSDKENINEWIRLSLFGEMNWFVRNNAVRTELANLGFQPVSVIVLALVYYDPEYEDVFLKDRVKFSRYAVGRDYHLVLKEKAKSLLEFLRVNYPDYKFRQGVDSLPVPEKIFAKYAGIGWQGKNTNIINEELGSYFFLSVILTDMAIKIDTPVPDRCGSCRACLDACPTGALFEPYKMNAGRCISHTTIEDRREALPEDIHLSNWVYGCDICQEVCPWNKKAIRNGIGTGEKAFKIRSIFKEKTEKELLNLSKLEFEEFVKESAMDRIPFEQFIRNRERIAIDR